MPFSSTPSHFPHRVLGHASAMLAYWDTDLVCRYASQAWLRRFGASRPAGVGGRMQDLLGEEGFAAVHPHILAVLDGHGREVESTRSAPDGKHRRALDRYFPDVVGAAVVGIVHEVADLAPPGAADGHALACAQLGVWQWHVNGNTVRFDNARARAIFGVAGDAWTMDSGVFCARYLHPEDGAGFRSALAAFAQGSTAFYFQGRLARRDGGTVQWIECTGGLLHGDGSDATMVGTVCDVSARMATSQALLRAVAELTETDTRRMEFLSILGHELRNCLTPIASGAAMLARAPLASPTKKLGEALERQVGHMARLIDDIYDVRRKQGADLVICPGIVSLTAVVNAAAEMAMPAMQQAGHTLTTWLPDDDIVIAGDQVRLTQAVANLLGNAAKFTPPHGDVAITLKTGSDGAALIVVADNGIGLAPGQADAIFGKYVRVSAATGNHDGLGIGLYLARQLVKAHGGTLVAVSAGVNRGCTMTVRLPLAPSV